MYILVLKVTFVIELRTLLSYHRPPLFERSPLPVQLLQEAHKDSDYLVVALSFPDAYVPKLTLVAEL